MSAPKKPAPSTKAPEIKREDRPGHLDPAHAARLRAKGEEGHTHDDDRAFVTGKRSNDALAEELAEDAVVAMTSGEDALTDDLAAEVSEERGGPFVPSTDGKEMARGTDASNPKGAKREPFPKT
ncbi:MAG: hypothetical protein ABI175_12210 [Polyangiales bacterium]